MATSRITQPFQLKMMTKTLDNVSISANSAVVQNISIEEEGWIPISLAGFQISNATSGGANVSYVTIRTAVLLSGSAQIACRNSGSSAAKVMFAVNILYQKA